MREYVSFLPKAILTILLGMAFVLAGCYPREILREKEAEKPAPPDPFVLGEESFQAGNYERAVEEYLHYLELLPRGPKARAALVRIAEAKKRLGRPGEAIAFFNRALQEFPEDPEVPLVEAELVDLYYQTGEYRKSADSASLWLKRHPTHPWARKVSFYLARSLDAQGALLDALRWYVRAVTGPEDGTVDRGRIEERIVEIIQGASLEELRSTESFVSGTPYAVSLYHQMATRLIESDRLLEAKEAAKKLLSVAREPFWEKIGRELLARLEEELAVEPGVIGCLLPLSGPFAIYGQEVLNGIELGLGLLDSGDQEQPVEVVIRDTAADPDVAVRDVEELAREEKAIGLIGPLASRPALAAARKAQELGIPIITLTQREGITSEGPMVFRNFPTPSKEVEELVWHAVTGRKLKRFAILYPENPYGRYFMNLFWDKVEQLGGQITAVESYAPEETDFEKQIKKMVGLYYPRPESIARMLEEFRWLRAEEKIEDIIFTEEEPEPLVDFEAVFIPDNYQAAALIAPQFLYHNVFGIDFLGTSLWQSPELIDLAGDYLQGALIPSGFYVGLNGGLSPGLEDFVTRYRANFESDPTLLSATGYDTMRFLKEVLREKGPIKTRRDLQRYISTYDDFYGITGWIAFDARGEIAKEPILLTISGKAFKPVR